MPAFSERFGLEALVVLAPIVSSAAATSFRSVRWGSYNDYILPRLLDLAMRNKQLRPFRKR
jgi:hypothetical protein